MQSAILLSARLFKCLDLHQSLCRAITHSLDPPERSATTVAAGDEMSKNYQYVCIRACTSIYMYV